MTAFSRFNHTIQLLRTVGSKDINCQKLNVVLHRPGEKKKTNKEFAVFYLINNGSYSTTISFVHQSSITNHNQTTEKICASIPNHGFLVLAMSNFISFYTLFVRYELQGKPDLI